MTLETNIQAETKRYREEDVAEMDETEVRTAAMDLDIDGWQTTPLVTLREELVAHYRNDMRAFAYPSPQVAEGPGEASGGNPGNDDAQLTP